ncbi:hypothetical protein PGN_1809 [Porphyromonas gingivalis ATCC 33277]|uniref:Uncharacterized protein n=1 Tax=Porphyromonas gingivalis (strain ATCC 33277 / DSM 20709 / CIP 103683 / JCM 12257 / NCTC 11834 / 2561) TaxID=431947 RepID=B2RLT3_PORG3|nr:hypothetical protein PGN_1809 [Porphyromonas gingivalis ATCC 33277]
MQTFGADKLQRAGRITRHDSHSPASLPEYDV